MSNTQNYVDQLFINERNMLIVVGVALLCGAMYLGEIAQGWITTDLHPISVIRSVVVASFTGIVALTSLACLMIAVSILRKSPGEERGLWQSVFSSFCLSFIYGIYAKPFQNLDDIEIWLWRDLLVLLLGVALGVLVLAIVHNTTHRIS